MQAFLTSEERRSLSIVLILVAAGYLLVGWRAWREPDAPFPLDSLDLAFARLGAELSQRPGSLDTLQTSVSGKGAGAARETGPVDLNRADSLRLLDLPGIGPTKVAAILAWRKSHGKFRRIEDLLEVKGIGPATLKRMRDKIVVTMESSVSEAPPAGIGRAGGKQRDTQ